MIVGEEADVVRTKNAGPYQITIDIIFDDSETYEELKATGALTEALFAELYHVDAVDVEVFEYDPGNAFKITIPRKHSAGSPGDYDLHGAQQHAPILDLEV
jgi:hypothetical protein